MNAMALDTHAHVKRLVGAGMSESQAEAVIEALRQTAELPDIGHLATKADLQIAKSDLQSSIAEVRSELQATKSDLQSSIAEVRSELQATKSDLQSLIAELRAELTGTKGELRGEIAGVRGEIKGVRGELIWWIIGTGVVSTVAHLFFK